MMYPMRRLFHVKIWLTEVSSDDDDEDEEHVVVCAASSDSGTLTNRLSSSSLPRYHHSRTTSVGQYVHKLKPPLPTTILTHHNQQPHQQQQPQQQQHIDLPDKLCLSNNSDVNNNNNVESCNYDGDTSEGYETLDDMFFDGDTSTEGSTSPDLLLSNEAQTLNVNAPAFTSVSSMTPVIITKNIEIGNERWKPNATIVEENINAVQIQTTVDLQHQQQAPVVYSTENLYYFSPDIMNGFHQQPVMVENIPNGTHVTAVVNDHDPQSAGYPITVPQLTPAAGPELVNQALQNTIIPGKDIGHDELKRLIQLQFEYYFSRENLANDSYLVSQMDGDQYVSISTVAKFNQVRKLTSDMNLIVEALKESPYVQLDETEQKVRANMKRCIVILREIPESTPIEDVKALFQNPNCPKWISFEYAYNDNWYVTFECEDDAKRAYRYLREEVQSFNGRPLMARIKAKTLLSRTVYLPKNANSTVTSSQSMSTPSESITSNFSSPPPQAVSTFTLAPASAPVFPPQHHNFPYFTTTTINGGPAILPHATWLNPRQPQFIQPEFRAKTFNKYNSFQPNKHIHDQRPFFSGKPRYPFRNNNHGSQKVPFHERNGNVDYDETRQSNSNNANNNTTRRPTNTNHGNHIANNTNNAMYSNPHYRRGGGNNNEDTRFVRYSNNPPKKEYRSNTEESPRFQRLRERRVKDVVPPKTTNEKTTSNADFSATVNGELSLDLALENFPALPSPNSPNEILNNPNKTASTLKELATNALREAEQNSEDSPSPVSTVTSSDLSSAELLSTSSIENTSPTGGAPASASTFVSVTTSNSSGSGTSAAPKISYAQMAQKPNSINNIVGTIKDSNETDVAYVDNIEPVAAVGIDTKKTGNSSKTDTKNATQQAANKSQKKQQPSTKGGSPRTQRSNKTISDSAEKPGDVVASSGPTPAAPVMKETYASKFGTNSSSSSSSSSTSNSDSIKLPSSVPPQQKSKSNPINSTSTNNKVTTGMTVKPTTLPAPRPLMSQVINPPACKLNEVHELQQKSSFSDTVKKTGNEVLPSTEKIEISSEKSSAETTISPSMEATNKEVVK